MRRNVSCIFLLTLVICVCYCNKSQPSVNIMDDNSVASAGEEKAWTETKSIADGNGVAPSADVMDDNRTVNAGEEKETKDVTEENVASLNKVRMPYEATWMVLQESGNSYIVPNFYCIFNSDKGNTRSHMGIKIYEDTLISIGPMLMSEVGIAVDTALYLFDTVEKKNNGSYRFHVNDYYEYYLFQWFDKNKHIARWTIFSKEKKRCVSDYLYIDSLYNTFPIVDYEPAKWTERDNN